jgi:hypothetical protein
MFFFISSFQMGQIFINVYLRNQLFWQHFVWRRHFIFLWGGGGGLNGASEIIWSWAGTREIAQV